MSLSTRQLSVQNGQSQYSTGCSDIDKKVVEDLLKSGLHTSSFDNAESLLMLSYCSFRIQDQESQNEMSFKTLL